MSKFFWHQELYGLLFLCELNDVEKTVLDCGAGGPRPLVLVSLVDSVSKNLIFMIK